MQLGIEKLDNKNNELQIRNESERLTLVKKNWGAGKRHARLSRVKKIAGKSAELNRKIFQIYRYVDL